MQTYVQRKTEQKKEQFTVYSLVYVYIYIYILIFKLLLWYFLFFEPLNISILLSLVNLQLQVRAKWRWGAWHSGFLSFCVTSPLFSLGVRTVGLGGCSCMTEQEWRLESTYHWSHMDYNGSRFPDFSPLLKWGSKSEQMVGVLVTSLAWIFAQWCNNTPPPLPPMRRQTLARKSSGLTCYTLCRMLTWHTNNRDPGMCIPPPQPYPKDWKGKC